MDTRWKKSKMICSFMAFATGLTILDYQESEEFRYLISEKLSDLLGIATGGQAYSATQENVLQEQTVAEENFVEEAEAFGGNWDDYQAYLDEQQAYYEEMMADMGYGYAGEEGYIVDRDYDGYYSGYYYGYDYADQESRDRYMAAFIRISCSIPISTALRKRRGRNGLIRISRKLWTKTSIILSSGLTGPETAGWRLPKTACRRMCTTKCTATACTVKTAVGGCPATRIIR